MVEIIEELLRKLRCNGMLENFQSILEEGEKRQDRIDEIKKQEAIDGEMCLDDKRELWELTCMSNKMEWAKDYRKRISDIENQNV